MGSQVNSLGEMWMARSVKRQCVERMCGMDSEIKDGANRPAWRASHGVVSGLLMVLSCGVGCTQQEGEDEGVSTRVASLSDASVPGGDVLGALPSKDSIARAMPVVEVLEANAAEVASHRVADGELSRWNEAASEKLASAPLPVIYPATLSAEQWRDKIKVTVGEHWYAIAMQDGDLNVYLQGTRTRFEHPSMELDAQGEALIKDAPYVVSRTHGILTLSFERFGGLGYHIDVECRGHVEDPRCADETFIVSLYDSLVRMREESKTAATGGVQ